MHLAMDELGSVINMEYGDFVVAEVFGGSLELGE